MSYRPQAFPKYVWRVSVCFSNRNCVIINRRYLGMNSSNWSPDLMFICYFRNFRCVATALSFIQLQWWKGFSARGLTETLVRNMYDVKSKISVYENFDLCWKHWINTKWLEKSKSSLYIIVITSDRCTEWLSTIEMYRLTVITFVVWWRNHLREYSRRWCFELYLIASLSYIIL